MMKFSFLMVLLGLTQAKHFPENFKLGTASASYQIEGAWNEDGKGPSIWDDFVHADNGKIVGNATGDLSCDSYHKYKDDFEILEYLGVQVHRYSISWPRIFPEGSPYDINQPGIDYYVNFTKKLVARGIEPVVTLYHWDLPRHIEEMGGWLNPEIAEFFGEYARVVYKNLGPYVKYWLTINEPLTFCTNGYGSGAHAPGKSLLAEGVYQCAYNTLRAHAKAYHIYHEEFDFDGKVTMTSVIYTYYPKNESRDNVDAAERAFEFNTGIYLNAIYNDNWPQVVIDRVSNLSALQGYSFSRLPTFSQEEIDYISGTADFFALNIYTSYIIEAAQSNMSPEPSWEDDAGYVSSQNPNWPKGSAEWLYSDPSGARIVLNQVQKKYRPKEIMITENGWSGYENLDDEGRISYLKGYLSNVLDAILEDGINVIGYIVWSFMDNFEWASGYSSKFGLAQVDFSSPNRTRTLRKSAQWYKNVIDTRILD